MKRTVLTLALLVGAQAAHADGFFGSNNGEWKMGPNGPYYEESNWPEWTPMYWMEEMMDSFDNNNGYNNNRFGNMPFFGNNSSGYQMPTFAPNMTMPTMGYGNTTPYMAIPQYYPAPMTMAAPQVTAPVAAMQPIPPAPTLAPTMTPLPQATAGTPGPASK